MNISDLQMLSTLKKNKIVKRNLQKKVNGCKLKNNDRLSNYFPPPLPTAGRRTTPMR